MSDTQTIKQLYVLALAEGEGVGTAYEYYAKRLVLLPWLAKEKRPDSILVAGLPEKYGASLDFLLLGAELGCRITVVDDRSHALARFERALETLKSIYYSPSLNPQIVQTGDLSSLHELKTNFDLAVSSEVLQRLTAEKRQSYVSRLQEASSKLALFSPNGDNDSHVGISGLNGLKLEELDRLMDQDASLEKIVGFIDMPPFPPGITRSETQRKEASSGSAEAFAMWGLGVYARMEKYIPQSARRKYAHIVYGLQDPRQR
jgi:hypothetical protein